MLAWQVWLIVAGVCLVIEIITVGFLVFWFAVAAAITALLSLFIKNVIAQTACFVIISAILILCTRRFANKFNKSDNTVTNVNTIIGKEGIVKIAISPDNVGQIKVKGDTWTACLDDSYNCLIPKDSIVEIVSIDGVKAIVKPIKIVSVSENNN